MADKEKKESVEVREEIKEANSTITQRNPWMIAAVVLGVALLVTLFFAFKGGATGNVISEEDAGNSIVDFLNEKTGGGVSYISASDKGNVYEITVAYNGEDIPVYVTKDGQYFVQSIVPITETDPNTAPTDTPAATEVPKSDKPVVEAYIYSYCPYGLQFEKALIPVYNILKDKADIKIVAIGAMHGEYEKVESLRQICIEKNYGTDKLFKYLEKFNADTAIGTCGSDQSCSKPLVDKLMTSMAIDKTKIETCMANDAEALYEAQVAKSSENGVSGSPTFIINGVESQVSRTPAAILAAVCSAFNTAPAECSQTLSTAAASAGFGGGSSSGAATGAQC